MASDAALRDLCELIVDCPHSTPKWTDTGVLVLRSHNIRGGRLDLSDRSFTDEEHYKQRSRRGELRAGDLVITREAPMGEVCMVPKNLRCCLGQRMVLLRPDPDRCDGRFLLYAIQSPAVQHQISWSEGTGSTVSNLRIPHLEALRVPTPPLSEQQAIAGVLGSLDDKIEQNRRTARKLEALARAVFKAWFVDFEPVKAKAAGATAFPGMPAETFATLPTRLVDSELGPVPEGWYLTDLGHEYELQVGYAFKSVDFTDRPEAVRLIRGDNVKEGWIEWGNKTRRWKDPNAKVLHYSLAVGDVVIGMDGSKLGKNWARVREYDLPALLVQRVARFRANGGAGSSLLWLLISDPAFREFVDSVKTGTSIPHISGGQLRSFGFVKPGSDAAVVWASFEQAISPLLEMADHLGGESRKLATLRDYLLPRLLSGKVRVRAAEKRAAEVA